MPLAKYGPTNLTIREHVDRVAVLADAIEAGRRIDHLYIQKRFKITRPRAYVWMDRARREVARRKVSRDPETIKLVAAISRASLAGHALAEGATDAP
jgi:hypothetical protein